MIGSFNPPSPVIFRNQIVGGDFSTNPCQRGTTFTAPVNGAYTLDRWQWNLTGAGVVDITRTADAPTAVQAGMFTQHCLDIAVTTADASIATGDVYRIGQKLEGINAAFLGFGQAGALQLTVSFWVKSTKTGTFWITIRNGAATRCYVTSYLISASNTWEFKSITVPGDVTGTWLYDTGIGISIIWLLACGTTFITTPNTWTAGNFFAGVDPTVNAMDTIGNHFKLALVQVEAGTAATPFEPLPQAVLLNRCRRYYQKSFALATAPVQNVGSTIGAAFALSAVAAASFGTRVEFDSSMRAVPVITTYNPNVANANWRDTTNAADRTVTVGNQSESGFTVKGAAGAAAADNFIHWQAIHACHHRDQSG